MQIESSSRSEIKAIVDGKEFTQIPDDLFIPPDALEILLDSFSGPLDLLLYLIRKQDIDILDIPIVSITQQYLHYIHLMKYRKLELAADYLLMAAMLAEIKSRLLLPISPANEEEEEDPRMTLVRRLQAYEQIKLATELLNALPRQERDNFLIQIIVPEIEVTKVNPEVALADLITAMKSLLKREEQNIHHKIVRETISVRERMVAILHQLQENKVLDFRKLFTMEEGRGGLVVSLLAILELARQSLVVITQNETFSTIYLQAA
ncbi:segregation and condensation protein A [Legionella sp.]|uniref:segregation and condensation protein A n=1 Tax=Legionella sp. TaxID=459 RepID=UPI003C94EB83